jgi:hypothetical protein
LPSYCSKDRKCPPSSCNFWLIEYKMKFIFIVNIIAKYIIY